MLKTTPVQTNDFLEFPNIAQVATLRADGAPQAGTAWGQHLAGPARTLPWVADR